MNRTELFLKAADKLRADFEESRVIQHPGVKGGEAEKLVRKFLNEHLPERFRAGSGFIVDRRDIVSPQTDVVIYDALNCPRYRVSDEGSVYPSDNVAAVIEVKSLLNKEQMEDAWNKVAAVKSLFKTPEPNPHVHSNTLGLVFGFKCANSVNAIAENYEELFRSRGFGNHVDVILILDEVVISLAAPGSREVGWQPSLFEGPGFVADEGVHVSVASTKAGRHSLDMFFRVLLIHLALFRHRVDHPGFKIPEANEQAIRYLFSVTHETEPKRREAILRKYADDVAADFTWRAAKLKARTEPK